MKINLICDGQYGSTGKGLLAGKLAQDYAPQALFTAWGPNAGHTYIDCRDGKNGRKYVHRMLANGIVSPRFEALFIGPGSVVDFEMLEEEIQGSMGHFKKNDAVIFIHPNVAVALPRHKEREEQMASMVGIGSTRKGVGAAVTEKIARDANNPTTLGLLMDKKLLDLGDLGLSQETIDRVVIPTPEQWTQQALCYRVVQIEGAQGFSLGINSGIYPYVTSRECTPAQIVSDCAFPALWKDIFVWGVLRTFPIRVANRYNDAREMIGYSGPGYDDQLELAWESIGVEPELTTVTKLPRRLFTFSKAQTRHFIDAVQPRGIFLNFCNYATKDELIEIIREIKCNLDLDDSVLWLGYGPTEDLIFSNMRPELARS